MKILCVFGQYQYGNPLRGVSTEYAAFIPALKRLGHEVIHFESWDRSRYRDFGELNQALLNIVQRERPDVMLTVQLLYEIWLETLQIIKAKNDVATICWATDDSWKYREFSRLIGHAYHAMATTYESVVPEYHRDSIHNVVLTQWAANAEALKEPLPATACRYKVTFIGAAHGDRRERIAELSAQGIDVACFGHGWPAGSVVADDIPRIMRESVISLNFANSRGVNQIKARTFEVPGAGGFLLTEAAPGLDKFYIPGRDVAVFSSMDEMVAKIKHYLSHPEERDKVAWSGFERTVREHTYDARMHEIINFALAARDEDKARNIKSVAPSFDVACSAHRPGLLLRILRLALLAPCVVVWGRARGSRAARRILFEISWRLVGNKTYSASGWPGRLFYHES